MGNKEAQKKLCAANAANWAETEHEKIYAKKRTYAINNFSYSRYFMKY